MNWSDWALEVFVKSVLMILAFIFLLWIFEKNRPPKPPAQPRIECTEWQTFSQEYKDIGPVGEFQVCVRYGENNAQE